MTPLRCASSFDSPSAVLKRWALVGLSALVVGGTLFLIDYGAFGRYDYVADAAPVDPVVRARSLLDEGKLLEAQEWIELYLSLPGESAKLWSGEKDASERASAEKVALRTMLADVKEKRESIAYQADEIAKGFFFGESAEPYGQGAEVVSNFFVVGDIRDLATSGIKWLEGEDVDYFVTVLSAAGIALTIASFGPQAPAAASAKTAFSALKVAKRAGKVPPALEREVLELAGRAAKGEAKLAEVAAPLADLASFAKSHGSAAALEAVGRSEKLADLPRVVKAAEGFGDEAAAALRFGGRDVVKAVEKHGATEVKAVMKYGEDAVGKLSRMEKGTAKTLLRDMRRYAFFSGKAVVRATRTALAAVGLFGSVLGALLSAAVLLKGVLAGVLRFLLWLSPKSALRRRMTASRAGSAVDLVRDRDGRVEPKF